jgi:hypothetical protein
MRKLKTWSESQKYVLQRPCSCVWREKEVRWRARSATSHAMSGVAKRAPPSRAGGVRSSAAHQPTDALVTAVKKKALKTPAAPEANGAAKAGRGGKDAGGGDAEKPKKLKKKAAADGINVFLRCFYTYSPGARTQLCTIWQNIHTHLLTLLQHTSYSINALRIH